MNDQKLLGSTMLAALAIATVGGGKFPPPSRYTGVFLLWFVLGLVAQFGRDAARFCSALAGLVVLAMAMGKTGEKALAWLRGVGGRLAPAEHSFAAGPGAMSGIGHGPGGRAMTAAEAWAAGGGRPR